MKVLIINNDTKYISNLAKLFNNFESKIILAEKISFSEAEKYDLIILSGSSKCSVLSYQNTKYKTEIEILKSCKKPIIGICVGFELIAYSFNLKLYRRQEKIKGIVEVDLTDNSFFDFEKRFRVYNSHRWYIKEVQKPLMEIAMSKYGVEIMKHEDRNIWGLQFHPEVTEPQNEGSKILDKIIEYCVWKELF